EARGGCLTTGDSGAVATVIDSGIAAIATALRPTTNASGCSASKLTASGKYGSYILAALSKQRNKANGAKLVQGHGVGASKLRAQFQNAETQSCQTTGDVIAILGRIDQLIGDATEAAWPVSVAGVRYQRPAGWHLNAFPLGLGGDIQLNDFANQFGHGAMVP